MTAVLIGRETADREWVRYEIEQSIERGNALFGVHLHRVKDATGKTARQGRVPALLKKHDAPIHVWTNAKDFGEWVEAAWREHNAEPDIFDRAGAAIADLFGFGRRR